MPKIGRNEPCPCKQGLKYKNCHGDPVKIEECNYAAKLRMAELIVETKLKKGMICEHGVTTGEHCVDCKVGD